MSFRAHRVSEVARIARVSVRTLHHYDSIGLLVPSRRTAAAYRLYSDSDLLRLQQILIGRELGLGLEEIRRLLDDPTLDRRELLSRQRAQLVDRLRSTQAMLRSIDAALAMLDPEQMTRDPKMGVEQLFEGFDPSQYQDEVRTRWGDSDAYKESARRTARYSAEDWRAIKMQWDDIMTAAANALQQQVRPADEAAMELAERHRQLISRWFYPCSTTMHTAFADMYAADERFARSIDGYAAGLTPFWSAAIRANAERRP